MPARHIHIVGCAPRSGTTLMAELVRSCFDIDGFEEHEKSIFKIDYRQHNIFVSKSPNEAIYMPWLLRINTDLWCIYMLRDPRDVITSRHRDVPDRYYTNLRIWKTYNNAARRMVSHPRFIRVRYEDLASDPDTVQATLKARMPFLKQKRLFSSFGQQTEVSEMSRTALNDVRPINVSSIGKWHQHLPRIKRQIQLHGDIAEDLIRDGYEHDNSWLQALKNITADDQDSFEPESLSLGKRLRLKNRLLRKLIMYTLHTHFPPTHKASTTQP